MRSLQEWAADNGSYGRCPRCGDRIWIESGCSPVCDRCYAATGWGSFNDDNPPDRERDTLASLGMSEDDFR